MPKTIPTPQPIHLDRIIGGGQAIGTLESGKKALVWGGLPGEDVVFRVTKKKSSYVEGAVTEVLKPSLKRVAPRDPESYLSTSPWQIMDFELEQHYKAALIEEAFELHDIVLPDPIDVYTDGREYHYRNKVEFSWYGETDTISGVDTLHLAFFRRGSKGKIVVDSCSLLPEQMMKLATAIRDLLRSKAVSARSLKTLLIRCDQTGQCVWQLYLKDKLPDVITNEEAAKLPALGGEIIYSNPKSPASVITERLASYGEVVLTDTVLGVPFRYATEGFFQVNIPVYEQALKDMREWIDVSQSDLTQPTNHEDSAFPAELDQDQQQLAVERVREERRAQQGATSKVLDLYSGVGSIGLTIGGEDVTLVELNEHAVREMRENIARLGIKATAVLAASEQALDYITADKTIIVDPPRAGLHADVIERLRNQKPARIIYLSCNPVTQARDVALLCADEVYGIRAHQGYNFFPRTPHIEHLVILDMIQ